MKVYAKLTVIINYSNSSTIKIRIHVNGVPSSLPSLSICPRIHIESAALVDYTQYIINSHHLHFYNSQRVTDTSLLTLSPNA